MKPGKKLSGKLLRGGAFGRWDWSTGFLQHTGHAASLSVATLSDATIFSRVGAKVRAVMATIINNMAEGAQNDTRNIPFNEIEIISD